ncbi:MAG: YqgE/AlgH family protein [Planctomycetales bacterium]|nr:YqgE/AlgH family protein [Planctomycetales bacterium]
MNRFSSLSNPTLRDLSLRGTLLVASPNVSTGPWQRAVCLLVHHSEQGAIGVCLNRTIQSSPKFWKELFGLSSEKLTPKSLHFGGPQAGPVVAIHDCQEFAEYTGGDGVYVAAQVASLRSLVSKTEAEVRIFVGQANWGPGQLEQELGDEIWLPVPVSPQIVFADEQKMWVQAMRIIANSFVARICGVKIVPNSIFDN